MAKTDLRTYRKSYDLKQLRRSHLLLNPFEQFKMWFREAEEHCTSEVNAMSLATSDKQGNVSVRIVLLKEFSEEGFVFFTNYSSKKSLQLDDNPKAAILFYWPELQRQVRIEGKVRKISAAQSDEYFNSRPQNSRISASISEQSSLISNRAYLEELFEQKQKADEIKKLKRPKNWGGFCVKVKQIEFWQGRSNRLHDRFIYKYQNKSWVIERLAP